VALGPQLGAQSFWRGQNSLFAALNGREGRFWIIWIPIKAADPFFEPSYLAFVPRK
jgi:hypothetical protein